MRGFRHQHTSDLSASLTCSTMAFDIDYLESQVDAANDATKQVDVAGQELSVSVKLLMMKLLVKALMSKTNFDAAISMADELLQDAPNSVYPHYALGTAFSKIGENDKAVYHCRRFLEIEPIACDAKFKQDNLATVYNNLAVSLKTLGFLDQAEIEFKQALALDDQFAAAYNNYGNLLNDKARLPEARQCFLRAIEINPDDHIAYWNLHATSNEMDEAQSIIEACISKSPTDEIAIFTLAGLRAFNGDERAFKELLKYGFKNEPLVRSIEWILSLPKMPEIHFNRWSIYDRAIALSDAKGHSMNSAFGWAIHSVTSSPVFPKVLALIVSRGFPRTVLFHAALIQVVAAFLILKIQNSLLVNLQTPCLSSLNLNSRWLG